MSASADPDRQVRLLILAFVLSGIVVIALAVALAILLDPLYLAIALFSLVDLALAWAFATGRMGPRSLRRKAEAARDASAAAAAVAAADPSYNPYARED
jgi:membrane protein implicated in regulation of membrane protease activity